MKNIKYIVLALTVTMASFASFAAESINAQQAKNLTEAGIISAEKASTLSSLEEKLASKAAAKGASNYRIISVTGNNLLYGTAIIYK